VQVRTKSSVEMETGRSVRMVIAHQGGWDEMLLVLAPIAVVAALLWIAKRRVDRAAARRSDPLDAGTDRR
jgi:cyanate permease